MQDRPADPTEDRSAGASLASLTLPDAPGIARDSPSAVAPTATGSSMPEASPTQKYIEPGQAVPRLTAKDKALLGLRDAFSPFAGVGWLTSAGYEQILNDSPNYGTDRGAFGQRLGAAAVRDVTEDVFSDSVMSPLLREDPRYYRLGPAHNFFVRLVYAGTRTIVTRTDGGKLSPNLGLLTGTLAGSALASTYYPPVNRGFTQTMETFGGSLGGSAVGDVVSEFYGDAIQLFRHK